MQNVVTPSTPALPTAPTIPATPAVPSSPVPVKTSGLEQFWLNYWPYIAVAAGIIILILLILVIVYLKRKKAKKEAPEEEPAVREEEKPKQKGMAASTLVKIWKAFLKEIPRDLRRGIMIYDHFVILGGSGSGKSQLVNNYTDWSGYARQFYPSYTENPLLQIYLGSQVMIQELAAPLLFDLSEDARKALLKLWKKIFRNTQPTVVAVLNGSAFLNEQDYIEYITREAQFIRGKINLISRATREATYVRIAVTHLDMIEGFSEFYSVAVQNNIPLKLTFKTNDELSSMANQFESFEEHLSSALLSLPANDYLKAISFIRQTKKLLDTLVIFTNVLLEYDPLSRQPQVEHICLTSFTEKKSRHTNPFTPVVTGEELEKYDPNAKHRIAAVSLCALGVLFLIGSFFYELRLLNDRRYQVAIIDTMTSKGYEQKIHMSFPEVYLKESVFWRILPVFFSHKHNETTRLCIEGIRRSYLYPRLESYSSIRENTDALSGVMTDLSVAMGQQAEMRESTQDKLLYVTALVYATDGNELGRLVLRDITHFSDSLGLPEMLIRDYVKHNQVSWPVSNEIKKLSFVQPRTRADQIQQMMSYQGKIFFTSLSGIGNQPIITQSEYEKLVHDTDHFLTIVNQYDLLNRYIAIVEILKKETPLTVNAERFIATDLKMDLESIKGFLAFVKSLKLQSPQKPEGLKFNRLTENINAILTYNRLTNDKVFKILFANEEFRFSAQQWIDLFNRSRICIFLHNFVNYYKEPNGLLFFFVDSEFDDVIMNETNDGGFLFTGKARIDGRFTKEALEKRVRPVLTDLPALINSLAIPQSEKNNFMAFFRREVEYYGRLYADAYRKYYVQFDIKVNSLGALRFALNQMFLPSSGFMNFLQAISTNTQIDPGNNGYMQSIVAKLGDFEFTRRLMNEKKGTFPELEKYKAILDQMQADIQQDGPKKKDREDTKDSLKAQLTPLGRIAYAIGKGDNDSYLNLTRDWIDSVGIPKQWRDLFLAPVWTTYYLGMKEVDSQLGGVWAELFDRTIKPLYGKFPFNASSDEDATPEEIYNATHPNGRFWQSFKKTFTAYCSEEGGKWSCHPGPYGYPNFPPKMTSTVNGIAKITKLLWEKDGKEKPLQFIASGKPLPPMLPSEPMITLASFTVAQSSILNFNQQMSSRTLKHEWQNPCRAAVGIEFMVPGDPKKYQSTLEVPMTSWCFYKLLKKTEEFKAAGKEPGPASRKDKSSGEPFELSWVIDPTSNKIKSRPIELKLEFKSDPWKMIHLP